MKRWLLAICLLTSAGCGDSLMPIVCDGGSCDTQVSIRGRFQATYNRKVDLLFVIDDTPAIAPHLDAVASGLAGMVPELTANVPLPLSLHIGFVRAGGCDTSTRGAACGLEPPAQFLTSEWCNTITNQTGAFSDAFSCLGDLGAAGCGPAQPLSATVQVLTGSPRPGWEGFMRPEAYLMIVIISATDDASGEPGSPTPAVETAALLKSLKQDPSQVLVSIIGPGDCPTGDAAPPRLTEFAQQFGANGIVMGLCSGQFPQALQRVTESINYSLQPPCVRNIRDTDLETPGLQADCTIEDFVRAPDGSYSASRLPSCDESAPPCWRIGPTCPGGWGVSIERPADWCSEAGTNFTLECLSCADPTDPACTVTR